MSTAVRRTTTGRQTYWRRWIRWLPATRISTRVCQIKWSISLAGVDVCVLGFLNHRGHVCVWKNKTLFSCIKTATTTTKTTYMGGGEEQYCLCRSLSISCRRRFSSLKIASAKWQKKKSKKSKKTRTLGGINYTFCLRRRVAIKNHKNILNLYVVLTHKIAMNS